MILSMSLAFASAGFDPAAAAATFNGDETLTDDGTIRLWAEIARYEDPDAAIFGPAAYNSMTEWADGFYTPSIATCFGSATPDSGSFLLHVGPSIGLATGTPIVFVPGAGDNASRGFITLAAHMDIAGRPVFALTFATPHGDVFQHAELLADAIAVVKARTGAAQVDVVAHSKGGIAATIYTSNLADTAWPDDAYVADGTRYRGDVRKLVLIATPLGGIDTAFRWPAGNYAALDADAAYSPTSWDTWYPYTSAYYWLTEDLADQDLLADGADYFPGHRQMYARQDHPLPGSLAALGTYALQPDWYTTYEGGLGASSHSDGVDAAVAAGGDLIARLDGIGVDPAVRIYLLAGENPLMPNAAESAVSSWFGETWADLYERSTSAWSQLLADLVGDSLLAVGVTEEEVQRLASGALVLGEITGPSDGLVFVDSATDAAKVTARGAEVVETRIANLSHLDLLYASPITGELLIEDAATDPDKAWEAALGARYVEEDTINWVDDALAEDETGPGDTGPTDDTGATDETASTPTDSDEGGANPDEDGKQWVEGCACSSGRPGGGTLGGLLGLAAATLLRRRRAAPNGSR